MIERNGMKVVMRWHRTVDRQLAGSSRHVQLVSYITSLQLSGAHLLFANGGCSQSAGRTRVTAADACVVLGAVCVCACAPPFPPPLSLTQPRNLYSPSSERKEGPSWPFIFQFRASLFFFFFFSLQINALQSTLTDVTLHHFHDDT